MTFADRFRDRRAIVTGGAAGIGLSVARRLAAEGARVSLWDVNPNALTAAKSEIGAADIQTVDVSDPAQIEDAFQSSMANLGGLDVLVCSAGITGPNAPAKDYSIDDWRRVFDVNVHGLFICNKHAIQFLEQSENGRIVNVASIAGKEGNPNAPAYSASKAAVIGLTKSLGKELAKTSIRVNCVTPAAVRTAIFDQMSSEHIDFMLSKIPMGRFGTVDEIASLICWLASEEASFSTGGVFDVSGGRATY